MIKLNLKKFKHLSKSLTCRLEKNNWYIFNQPNKKLTKEEIQYLHGWYT